MELDAFGLEIEPKKKYFLSLDEILSMPPPQWLVKDLIPLGSVGILYGESNSWKSFLALHLAACCATGSDAFCNMPCKKADAFYIAAEGAAGIGLRAKAWIKHFKMQPENLSISPRSVYVDKDEVREEVIEEICSFPPYSKNRFVIIDTLSANFTGKENTDDMAGFLRNCQTISQSCNATVLVVHHTGKSAKQEERGHYSIRANADFSIRMSKTDKGVDVEIQKFRDSVIGKPLHLSKRSIEVAPGTEFPDSLVLVEDTGFEEEEDTAQIVRCAIEMGDGTDQHLLKAKIIEQYSVSETTANRIIRKALPDNKAVEMDGHVVTRVGSGKKKRIIYVRKVD